MLMRLLVVAACGAILSAALPPTGLWPLALALVPLSALVARSGTTREAFWLGFAFAIPFFVLYLLWLPLSFAVILTPGFWALFPLLVLALAAIWGGTTGLSRWLGGQGVGTLWLLPAAWVVVEWARSQGYLGFPWGTLGYLWLDTPVAQTADLVGVYGLSLVTASLASLFAVPFVPPADQGPYRRRRALDWVLTLIIPLALGASVWGIGLTRSNLRVAPPSQIALLVQGNVDPFGRAISPSQEITVHTDLTRNGQLDLTTPPDLVVWPEGAVLGFMVDGTTGAATRETIQQSAPDSAFVVGGRASEGDRSFNSVYSITGQQLSDRYDKVFLVPFGERWPLIQSAAPAYRAIFGLLGLPLLQSTSPGKAFDPLQTSVGLVATYICYESVFPQVQRVMVRRGAAVLINVTNDAWFARGNGARQHFDMGRLRAIETRRYLLRAGNDGITAAVDPHGRVLAELERGVAGTLAVNYGLNEVETPWVRYGHLLIPVLTLYLVLVAALTLIRRN